MNFILFYRFLINVKLSNYRIFEYFDLFMIRLITRSIRLDRFNIDTPMVVINFNFKSMIESFQEYGHLNHFKYDSKSETLEKFQNFKFLIRIIYFSLLSDTVHHRSGKQTFRVWQNNSRIWRFSRYQRLQRLSNIFKF